MAGSTFGTQFKITTWGESHGKGIGVVADGCPAGLPLCEEDIQVFLDRRKPGQSRYSTPRKEDDSVTILSGVFEGKTTGTPISLMVSNEDQRSRDYGSIASYYRPGHADFTFDAKYGFRDYRGGGRSSGRETIARVAAGAVASNLLSAMGIQIFAYSRSIGPVSIQKSAQDLLCQDLSLLKNAVLSDPLYMPDSSASKQARLYLEGCMAEHNSAGGIVECLITGVPAGLGEPVFDKLDASLAKAIFSIGAVKGFEIGDGFASAASTGLEHNDGFKLLEGRVVPSSNHAGGILGGISNGAPIIFRAAFKPTPSISSMQKTVNSSGEETEISIQGRHDPIIVPRAVVVVEAMAALVLADALLQNAGCRMEDLENLY